MESSYLIPILLIALCLFGYPLILLFQIVKVTAEYFLSDWWNRNLFFVPVDPLAQNFLEKNFRYYQTLNERDKKIFLRRVGKFIRLKSFESRGDLYLTPQMEVLVAATAVQITFGHPSVYFRHFHTIILYPDIYHSRITDQYHQGEVNTRGIIVLSFRNLVDGYMNPTDGRNLGLHEMAHAMRVADAIASGDDYDFLEREVFYEFVRYGRAEMERIANGEESFFRRYAATNDDEFFAVAVENFFERPGEFLNAHPELYRIMVTLLKQDPAAVTDRTPEMQPAMGV